MRLVAGIQLVAQILDVALYRPRSDAELLSALLRGQAKRNALQDLALSIGERHKIFLLPRNIHHASPLVEKITTRSIAFAIIALQVTECRVPNSDNAAPEWIAAQFVTRPFHEGFGAFARFRERSVRGYT